MILHRNHKDWYRLPSNPLWPQIFHKVVMVLMTGICAEIPVAIDNKAITSIDLIIYSIYKMFWQITKFDVRRVLQTADKLILRMPYLLRSVLAIRLLRYWKADVQPSMPRELHN